MTFERPHLRADEVQVGDRLLVADDLDLDEPLPAMAVVHGTTVAGDAVTLTIAGRAVRLPAHAAVVVERERRGQL